MTKEIVNQYYEELHKRFCDLDNTIHDGLLKNEEIYNIFDTGKFLNRPPLVAVSNTSGLAGIALWINTYYRLPDDRKVDKNSKLVTMIKKWVDEQYDEGRVTTITDNELVVQITDCCKKLNIVL